LKWAAGYGVADAKRGERLSAFCQGISAAAVAGEALLVLRCQINA